MNKAYLLEEKIFAKNVKLVFRLDIPFNASLVGRHVLYNVKQNDDGSLNLKQEFLCMGMKITWKMPSIKTAHSILQLS